VLLLAAVHLPVVAIVEVFVAAAVAVVAVVQMVMAEAAFAVLSHVARPAPRALTGVRESSLTKPLRNS
jgi:hypothetical protein